LRFAKLKQAASLEGLELKTPRQLDCALIQQLADCRWVAAGSRNTSTSWSPDPPAWASPSWRVPSLTQCPTHDRRTQSGAPGLGSLLQANRNPAGLGGTRRLGQAQAALHPVAAVETALAPGT
jgi:hypothetical protein